MRLLGAPAIPAPGLHPFLNQALRKVVGDIGGSHWRQFFNCFQRDFGRNGCSRVIVEPSQCPIRPTHGEARPPRLAIVFCRSLRDGSLFNKINYLDVILAALAAKISNRRF